MDRSRSCPPELPGFTSIPALQWLHSITQRIPRTGGDAESCLRVWMLTNWPEQAGSCFKPGLLCCWCTEECHYQSPTTKGFTNDWKHLPHAQRGTSEVSAIIDYLVNHKWLIHSLRQAPITETTPPLEVDACLNSWCVLCCPDAREHDLLYILIKRDL